MSRDSNFSRPRGLGGKPKIEATTARDETEVVRAVSQINWRTQQSNRDERAARKAAATKAKIKLPTFKLPGDE